MNTYEFDGPMRYDFNPGQPVYSPNTEGGPEVHGGPVRPGTAWESDGDMVRTAYTLRPEDDDFSQPNALVNKVMDAAQRDRLAETIASTLGTVRPDIRERVFEYWRNVDKAVGDAIAELVERPRRRAARPGAGQRRPRHPGEPGLIRHVTPRSVTSHPAYEV